MRARLAAVSALTTALASCAGDTPGSAGDAGTGGAGGNDGAGGGGGSDAAVDRPVPLPPGHLTFTVKHDPALAATDASDRDVRGTLHACVFEADPFAAASVKPIASFALPGVDLHDAGAIVSGTQGGKPAFPDLPAGVRYVLAIFLDDDGDAAAGACTDGAGRVQASAKDPIFVGDTPPVVGLATQDIAAIFDHRLEERIR